MSKDMVEKREIIEELDRRIALLKAHEFDVIDVTGNQYEELNQALKKGIGVPLMGELSSVRDFVCQL